MRSFVTFLAFMAFVFIVASAVMPQAVTQTQPGIRQVLSSLERVK